MEVNKYIWGDVFVKEYLLKNNESEHMFLNEVRIYEYLNDFEGTAKLKGYFKKDELRRIYLEKIDAKNIYELRIEKLEYIDKLKIYISILEEVKNLHSAGLIHNDISPSNILIDKSNNIYLIDFALSSFIDQKSIKRYISYTKSYSPIENYSKFDKSSIKTDIYSLSALFYYFIFNKQLCNICDLRYMDIESNSKIGKFLNKGLSFNKDKRFDNVDQMIEIIQGLIDEEIQRK